MITDASDRAPARAFWKNALWITLLMRGFYTLLAAGISLIQPVNLALMRSNDLTGVLVPDHGVRYLLLGCWERFDTLWYLHIAARGYDLPASVVFFPLYPGLIRVASCVLPPIAAALLISTAAFFFLLWGSHELLEGELPAPLAKRAIFLVVVWPASFIFLAGYAESLLLALIVWALVMARAGRWKRAAMLGLLAVLTKAAGVVVLVPMLWMAFRRNQVSAWPVLVVPLGSLAFPFWLHQTGHGSISSAYAAYWHTSAAMPWNTLFAASAVFVRTHSALLAVNFLALLACCVLVLASRMRTEYWLYAGIAILLCLTKMTDPPLQSMLRYVLIIFPIYAGLARWLEHPVLRPRFGLVCGALFAVNIGLFWLFLGWSLVL